MDATGNPLSGDICRLCLEELDVGISIFKDDFAQMIEIVSNIKIDPLDELPTRACIKCARKVKAAVMLKNRIIKSQQYLLKHKKKQNSTKIMTKSPEREFEEILIITEPNDNFLKMQSDDTDGDEASENDFKHKEIPKVESNATNNVKGSQKSDLPVECCNKLYNKIRKLVTHLKDHREPIECPFCGKTCNSYMNIQQHIAFLHNSPNIVCSICNKRFQRRSLYSLHLKRHLNKRDPECQECGEIFYNTVILARHLKEVHKNTKPYQCLLCPKSFSGRTNLNKHFLLHTKKNLFSCTICKKTFQHDSSLQNHMEITHRIEGVKNVAGPVQYQKRATDDSNFEKIEEMKCAVCSASFKTTRSLVIHLRKMHLDVL